jgi:glycosyltransferase involved in cell wall biosynthesis
MYFPSFCVSFWYVLFEFMISHAINPVVKAQERMMKPQQSKPKKRPTVMQVIPNMGAGGAEQTTVDVTAALVEAGHKAIIISNGGPRVTELQRAGGMHIQMPVHSKNPLTIWKNAKKLAKIIEEYRVDIIHARSRAPAWSALKAARDTGIKFLTTCHAPYNIRGSEWKRKYNSGIAKGDLVIANSEFVAHYLVDNYQVPVDKIRVIPRGIPLDKFDASRATAERMLRLIESWRIPEVATIVLLPGRLTRWKGQAVLIEAMSKIKRKDVYCVLLGDAQGRSEYRDELDTLIHEFHLEDRVRIAEHCDDMVVAYKLASIVVSASIEPEGFGRVAVEGQIMGIPTIATAIGGSKETIIDGVTGWLVPPDDADTLAKTINKILALSADEKAHIADASSHHARTNFTKTQMTGATLLVYNELMGL